MSAKNRPKFKELESALNELNLKTEATTVVDLKEKNRCGTR